MRIAYVAFVEIDVANACLIHTREISEQWALLGHDVTVILPRPLRKQTWSGVRHAWVRWWGFDRPRQLTFFLESVWRLFRLHRAHPFDVLYVREFLRHPSLPRLLHRLELPYFVEVNGWVLDDLRLLGASHREIRAVQRGQQKLLAAATGLVVSTAGNAEKITRCYGIPSERILVQELGTNVEHYTPGDRQRARQATGLPVDGLIILFAGSFHPHHDLPTLIDAFARLVVPGTPVTLVLVGQGSQWQPIRSRVVALGLASHVSMLEARPYEDMPAYFQAADIGVLPLTGSKIRQQNGALAAKLWDYMAAGLPVLVTDYPDTPSAALLGDKVYRVPPEDPQAMEAGLRALMENDDLRRRLSAAGLDYVRKQRTWRHAAEETIRFMQRRMAGASGRTG